MRATSISRAFCASIAFMGTVTASVAQAQSPPVVIPGMIDAHSHIALDRSGGPRISGPVAASVSFQGVTSPTVRSQMPTRRSKTAIQNQHNGLSDTPPL